MTHNPEDREEVARIIRDELEQQAYDRRAVGSPDLRPGLIVVDYEPAIEGLTNAILSRRSTEVERERDEAVKESADLTKALTGLTRQGSEFFIRKGDRFTADIPACMADVRERFSNAHKLAVNSIHYKNQAKAALATSEARVLAMQEALRPFAECAVQLLPETDDDETVGRVRYYWGGPVAGLSAADFRRARAAPKDPQ